MTRDTPTPTAKPPTVAEVKARMFGEIVGIVRSLASPAQKSRIDVLMDEWLTASEREESVYDG